MRRSTAVRTLAALLLGVGSVHAQDSGTRNQAPAPVLVVHGGAGVERGGLTAEEEAAVRGVLEQALRAGHAKLRAGASSRFSIAPAAVRRCSSMQKAWSCARAKVR